MAAAAGNRRTTWLITIVTVWAAFTLTMFFFAENAYGMPPPGRTLKVPVEGQTRIKTTRRESVVNARPRIRFAPANTKVVKVVASLTKNYNYCGGFSLKLRGKTINRRNFRPTVDDATILVTLLDGDSLDNKFYVWCRVGNMGVNAAKRRGRPASEVSVEVADKFQGDIRLSTETVDFVLKPFEQDFLRTNGRTVPRLSGETRSGPTTQAPEVGLTFKPPFEGDPSNPLRKPKTNGPPPGLGSQTRDSVAVRRGRQSRMRRKRKIMPWDFFLWDNAEIPFRIDEEFSPEALEAIAIAMDEWEAATCLRFIQIFDTTYSEPHLSFQKLDGCWSYIGKQSNGQPISVDEGCEWPSIVAHEIGHALGFYHEQSRPDRDNYVTINYNNMMSGTDSNFEKTPWDIIKTDSIPYDYSSVMHYGPTDFSQNDTVVIEPKDLSMMEVIGQREFLTFNDVKLANVNYCSRVCGTPNLERPGVCKNGGYRNPNRCQSCVCPRGYAPPFCDGIQRVTTTRNVCSKTQLTATEDFQTLTSPGYPSPGFPDNTKCNWLIKAPTDKRIVLDFVDDFEFDFGFLNITCDVSYVEVRRNVTRPGQRFCNKETPKAVVRSQGNEMLVILNGDSEGGEMGFKARYKTEQCGGCSATAFDEEMACFKTVENDCSQTFREVQCTTSVCTQTRRNTCFEEEAYCCEGFTLSGENCRRERRGVLPVEPGPSIEKSQPIPAGASTTTSSQRTTTTPRTTTTTLPPTTTTLPPTTTTTLPPTTTTLPPTTTTTLPPTTTTLPPTTTTFIPTTTTLQQTTTRATTTLQPTTTTTTLPTTTTTSAPTTVRTIPTIPTTPSFVRVLPDTTTTTTTVTPPTTTTTSAPVPSSVRWSRWSSCTQRCGMCGEQTRVDQCSSPPCLSETRLCPPRPCPPTSDPLTGCFRTPTGSLWCVSDSSSCFRLASRRSDGVVADGVRILGTVDTNTGKTTFNSDALKAQGVSTDATTTTTTPAPTPGRRRNRRPGPRS